MYGLFGYIPYAAVGYCVAALATDVWPALRSAMAIQTYPSSRHGMDGEWDWGTRQACGPDAIRNQAIQRSTQYCYNTATGRIEGNGPMDGIVPPQGTVLLYTDEDGRETAKIKVSGDNTMILLACHQPGGIFVPPGADPGDPRFDSIPPGNGDPNCGPRFLPGKTPPQFRRADCRSTLFRNNDPNRLRRRRARWG